MADNDFVQETFFKLPTDPEAFGVKLPTADLRRIDFSALEFDTLVRACVEYIKTYYPDQFNDFVQNNGIVMLVDLISFVGSIIGERGDVLVNESFLPTSFSIQAVSNHLALINERINKATPAVVDIEMSVAAPLPTSLNIPAGTTFNLTGADGRPLAFEAYRAPDNWTDSIQIPPGKRGIIAFGIEGQFETPFVAISAGGANQVLEITNEINIIDEPIFVDVFDGTSTRRWGRVEIIERSGPNDEVYEVSPTEEGIEVKFGDNKAGKAPLSGEQITVTYRIGGGSRGRIGSGRINESRPLQPEPPASATVEVTFRNPNPSSGGLDEENIEDAKKRAPRQAATLNAAVSGTDYAELASSFTHPVFGSVLKAVAAVKTSLNANRVELYVLAVGEDEPVKPSVGLKKGLKTYLEEVNVLTDEVYVYDGELKRVNVDANIVMSRNSDAAVLKSQVETIVDEFFNFDKFDMGQEFYLSDLYSAIQGVEGVKFVAIFDPTDDILATNELAQSGAHGVGTNELIILGEKQLRFYFE
jgi:hypothetical protein